VTLLQISLNRKGKNEKRCRYEDPDNLRLGARRCCSRKVKKKGRTASCADAEETTFREGGYAATTKRIAAKNVSMRCRERGVRRGTQKKGKSFPSERLAQEHLVTSPVPGKGEKRDAGRAEKNKRSTANQRTTSPHIQNKLKKKGRLFLVPDY